jgi:hypothetical protein
VSRAVVIGLAVLSGCAGARADVVAPTATFPISLTHAVRGADGAIVADKDLAVVGTFNAEKLALAILYSAVPVTGALDISDAVNTQVRAAGGDAVIDLQVRTQVCALDWIVVLHLLPIWPGCATVKAQGSIVKVVHK